MPFLHSLSQRFPKPSPNFTAVTTSQPIHKTSTMAATPIVLILGSGPRVGAAICETFAINGYQRASTVWIRMGSTSRRVVSSRLGTR